MKVLIGFAAVLVILSTQASGFGYYDAVTDGTVLGGYSPYTVALGTVRALGASEPASIFTNPAQVAVHPFSVQLSGSSISWAERVIETDINKTIRTLMTNSNGMAAVVYPLGDITIGAGMVKVAEFGYDGMNLILDDQETTEIGIELLVSSGSQIETMGSVSMVIAGPLTAGFSGGVRRAEAEYQYSFNSYHFLIPDSSYTWSKSNSEFAWHAGLALDGELFQMRFLIELMTRIQLSILAYHTS